VVIASLAGEVVLKSPRTRPRFERRLLQNVAEALERNGISCDGVRIKAARLEVECCSTEEECKRIVSVLRRVFGLHAVAVACALSYSSLEDLVGQAASIAAEWVRGKKFAVRARRSGVEPFTSLDVAKALGSALLGSSAGVDLENPDVEVYVEVRGSTAYVFREWIPAAGGLPIGVEGRALALFSGGLDSPVAVWMASKRGLEVHLLHFVLGSRLSLRDALRVARKLAREWLYGYEPILYAVDFIPVARLITALVPGPIRQLVLRLAMYNAASALAERLGFDALVTGESLGQVSSQTLLNLASLTRAHGCRTLILRPLIGMDKEEIVALSRRIGLYEISSQTKEYCQIVQGPAATRSKPEQLAKEYEKVSSSVSEAISTYMEIPLA
jgi:thiamine biosynthesis protein ThiI